MFYRIVFLSFIGMNFGFSEILYPDFILSMTRNGKDFRACEEIYDCHSIQSLQIFQLAYTKNVLLAKQSNFSNRIPKIIHQIWLGSPLPEKYFSWMRTWMGWYGWEYKLWCDEDVKSLSLYNQELYNRSCSYGELTDILRLEILLHYGGLYVDVDFECIKKEMFEELGRSFDFYIGFEPITHGTMNGIPKICNAIIAATPYHPLIKNLIVNMKANWMQHEYETGVQKAGPDYFSRTILDYERQRLVSPEKKSDNLHYRNMYLPCTFFYPFSDPELKMQPSRNEILENTSQETAGIHYWSGSWRPPFSKQEQEIELNRKRDIHIPKSP
ncbi:MAG: hypothetical protein RLZZ453_164 [Chlamydiota bacterium]|jgi:mannosyltransferase OCH1-like enzyme